MEISQKIVSQTDLQNAIGQLEEKHKQETTDLKRQFEMAYDSVKPVNLIKSAISDIGSSPEIKGHLLNSSLGLAAGVVSRFLFVGRSSSPLRKLAGTILMFGVTNLVSKDDSPVKTLGRKLLHLIRRKKNRVDDTHYLE